MKKKIKICACGTAKNKEEMEDTIQSFKDQSVKVDKIILTGGRNIAVGRNAYLKMAKGDIIFTFDSGCVYEKDYVKKMLKVFKKNTDIVMGIVLPQKPKTLIQEFCATRMPQYFRFSEDDWNTFVPSNRQVAFRKRVIKKLGLLPEYLSRADDTYWFGLARKKGLKFAHCNAIVYWETKRSLINYLKTVYEDEQANRKYKIKPASLPNKITPMLFPYGCFVCLLALIVKIIS